MTRRHPDDRESKRENAKHSEGGSQDAESKRATLVQLIGRLLARKWLSEQQAEPDDVGKTNPDLDGDGPA